MPYYLVLHVLKTLTLNDESRIDLFLKYPFIKCMVMKKEQIFMIHCTLLGLMADRTWHIGFNHMLYPLFYKSVLCLYVCMIVMACWEGLAFCH